MNGYTAMQWAKAWRGVGNEDDPDFSDFERGFNAGLRWCADVVLTGTEEKRTEAVR